MHEFPMMLRKRVTTVALAWAMVWATTAAAAPTLPGFFSDNMVLQRDKPVPIWGRADPGEQVTVRFAGQEVTTKATDKGKWKVALEAMPASSEPREFSVSSDKTDQPTALKNVVVGDVWVCSGQSNMAWPVKGSANPKEEIAAANHPMIRHMKVKPRAANQPARDLQSQWLVCSPQSVGDFTAVGYYFARDLQEALDVPIGLIGVNWGGTRIEPWTAPEGFRRVPELAEISGKVDATLPTTPKGRRAYLETLDAMRKWLPEMEAAVKNQTQLPQMPKFPSSGANHQSPSRIYHAMINPIIPYAIRGAIWYQGESNGSEGESYYHKKRALIEGWRERWGQGDFPFYFVQLANFKSPSDNPAGGDGWAKLREAQRRSLTIPNTGMAVIIDIGEARDIHPKNKQDVGARLALWALANEYGKDIVYSGPLYKSHEIEGNTIRIHFDHVGEGLMVGKKEGHAPTAHDEGGSLKQFAIAGADKQWHWATATIDGPTVVVSSDQIAEPVAVRYAYRINPEGANLYNQAGLPASPFRTDDW